MTSPNLETFAPVDARSTECKFTNLPSARELYQETRSSRGCVTNSRELQDAGVLPCLELGGDFSPQRMDRTSSLFTTQADRGDNGQARLRGLAERNVLVEDNRRQLACGDEATNNRGATDSCGDHGATDNCGDQVETGAGDRAADALKSMFDQIDLNKSGSLSKGEIAHAAVGEMLKADKDDDGAISLAEAVNDSQERYGSGIPGAVGHALADTNRDGKVDAAEMQKIGETIAEILMRLGDTNTDSKLGYDEFGRLFGGQTPRPNPEPPRPRPEPPCPMPEPPCPCPNPDVPPPRPRPNPDIPPDDRPDVPPDPEQPDKPGEVRKPTDAQIEQAFKQVENRGASERYMQELKAAMKEMPAEFVESFIKGRTKMIVYGQGPAGLGGTYNSGNNTITMYESAPFSTKGVLACEMAHNWDLNPYVGEHVTSEAWFQDAYRRARSSGISQGDNSFTNQYEFIHHMAKYYSGVHSQGVDALMDYLGEDYRRRTKAALTA